MGPTEALKELLFPARDVGVLLAIITFWLLGSLAFAAGLLGIWLLIMILPAFFRYSLYLLEARARGQTPPVPGIELFSLVGNSWSLFPLFVIAASAWLIIIVYIKVSGTAAVIAGVALLLIMPASMGILGMTYSPVACLNPLSLFKLIRSIGIDYLWAPAAVAVVAGLGLLSLQAGAPAFIFDLLQIYAYFLMFTMTGELLRRRDIEQQVDIPDDVLPDDREMLRRQIEGRTSVANHAYGFFSRGNRAGGLAHVVAWLRDEDDSDEAWQWFFAEMLKWENRDHALFFAQIYLHNLLGQDRDADVQKLLARCLFENERFRPQEMDRDAIAELLERHDREDLLKQLAG